MGILLQLAIGGAIAYFISDAFGISFWFTAIGIGLLYLSWRQGWFGGTTATRTGGGMFRGMWSMVVSIAVFTGLMMVATYFMSVSNSYATHQFVNMGWRFWLWPSGYALDLLLWTSVAFLAAWVAGRAAHGNARIAGTIFAVAALVIFGMMWLPTTTKNVVPVGNAAWVEADKALAKDGAVSVVALVATTLVAGKPTDLKTNGVVGSSARRAWRFLFGTTAERAVAKLQAATSSTAPAAPVRTTVVVKKIGQSKTLYRFGTDGCVTLPLRGGWSDYPKGGEIVFYSLETGQEVLRDKPGTVSGSSLPAGEYRICRYDPAAWGVEIWQ